MPVITGNKPRVPETHSNAKFYCCCTILVLLIGALPACSTVYFTKLKIPVTTPARVKIPLYVRSIQPLLVTRQTLAPSLEQLLQQRLRTVLGQLPDKPSIRMHGPADLIARLEVARTSLQRYEETVYHRRFRHNLADQPYLVASQRLGYQAILELRLVLQDRQTGWQLWQHHSKLQAQGAQPELLWLQLTRQWQEELSQELRPNQQAISVIMVSGDVGLQRGIQLLQQGRSRAARRVFQRLTSVSPQAVAAGAHYNLGLLAELDGKIGPAREEYRQACRLDAHPLYSQALARVSRSSAKP